MKNIDALESLVNQKVNIPAHLKNLHLKQSIQNMKNILTNQIIKDDLDSDEKILAYFK